MRRFVTGVRAVTVALRLAWARAARARCPPGRRRAASDSVSDLVTVTVLSADPGPGIMPRSPHWQADRDGAVIWILGRL